MININYLKWDSDFFNLNIGKITVSSIDNIQELQDVIKRHEKDFDLIYIFSHEKILINKLLINKTSSIYLVDEKIIFKKKVSKQLETSSSEIKNYSAPNINSDLLDLTYQSGIESRYNTDENFTEEQFRALYKKWITESVNGNIAKKVFVYEIKNRILGMVTVNVINNIGSIGLIAVDNSMRGKGIGSLLINKVENYLFKNNIAYLTVATQATNTPACNFYLNNNFLENEKTYIYHCWLKN